MATTAETARPPARPDPGVRLKRPAGRIRVGVWLYRGFIVFVLLGMGLPFALLVLLALALAVARLPAIGPSGRLPPPPARSADLITPAAIVATWLLFWPPPTQFTQIAAVLVGLGLYLYPIRPRARRHENRRELAFAVRVAQFPALVIFGGLAMTVAEPSGARIGLWVVLMVAYPLALHRQQLTAAAPTGTAPPPVRVGRIAAALALVAVLTPISVALAPTGPRDDPAGGEPAYGEPGAGADGSSVPTYWGFGSVLDTSVRAELPDTEVLRVQAEHPDYWRATSYDHWDGRQWTQSATYDRGVVRAPAPGQTSGTQYLPTIGLAGGGGTGAEMHQTFLVQAGVHEHLYAAATPIAAETPGLEITVGADTTLRSSHPLGPGTQWSVTSRRAGTTAADLRALGTVPLDHTDGTLVADGPGSEALQVPADVPDRVRELAAEVTAGSATTYDEVLAIEAWLAANIEYTTLPPQPLADEDAVDRTLFVDRVGSCDQIASAFVIMARAVGIPARVAVGYTPHRYDAARDEYVSRASDAHAWAEVWFGPAGWVAFDPTTDVPLSGETPADATAWLRGLAPWLGALVAAVVAGALADRIARRWMHWRTAAREPNRPVQRIIDAYERAVRARTRRRRPGETLISYARAVTPVALHERSVALAEDLSAAAFSPAQADVTPLRDATRDLKADWPHPPWRRLFRRRRHPVVSQEDFRSSG